jgi:FMN phosphatase YigB (HAD superfamily)
MNRLAIVDIDGVVCNSEERFARCTTDGKVNWNLALSSQYVHLDVVIPGAVEALEKLERRYTLVFLTNRPSNPMRSCTVEWLYTHGVALARLEMKPASEQRTKTKAWKARRVGELVGEYRATDILLIEDEPANADEIIARNTGLPIVWFESLSAAVAAKGE